MLDPIVRQHSDLVEVADGFAFRDLNKNGKLDVYEDPRQPLETRVEDLPGRMTLAEKAGQMFISGASVGEDGAIEEDPSTSGMARAAGAQMVEYHMTHFNLWAIPGAQTLAVWYNNLQRFAETTRLGIPVTIASDPRNHFSFGGESAPELVVVLVEQGLVAEARVDVSVRRLLRLKFQLGLFDQPFVDLGRLPEVLGRPSAIAAGEASQRRSMTLLKNSDHLVLLAGRPRIVVQNLDAAIASEYGEVVPMPEAADVAILRLQTPWYPVETENPLARSFHHGDLDFKGEAKAEILALLQAVPTIVVLHLDRPAVVPEINEACRVLLADYGAGDAAVLDVIFGRVRPEGKLSFELPSSMEAVRNQKSDLPYDSEAPLYPFGFGLSL